MEAKIRRTQDNLFVLGTSVIAFGLWNLIKFTVYFFVNFDEIIQVTGEKSYWFSVIFSWLMIFISFLIRCYVGFSARSEGKGKHKSVLYLVFAGLITFVYFLVIVCECIYFVVGNERIVTVIVTLIIDVTSLVFLVELMVNSIKIRKLRKDGSK